MVQLNTRRSKLFKLSEKALGYIWLRQKCAGLRHQRVIHTENLFISITNALQRCFRTCLEMPRGQNVLGSGDPPIEFPN